MRNHITLIILLVFHITGMSNVVHAGLNDGLVAYYQFEGNASDSTGSNNGTESGGLTYVAGATGQAASLDGVDDYIQFNHSSQLDSLTDELTISFWVKKGDNNLSNGFPIAKRSYDGTDNDIHFMVVVTTNGINFQYSGASGAPYPGYNVIQTPSSTYDQINDNRWHLITVTHKYGSRENTKIYVDGVARDITWSWDIGNPPAVVGGSMLVMGKQHVAPPSSGFFNGLLDGVRFYNRILSVAEIEELLLEGLTLNDGLVAHYKFDGNVNDSTGNYNGAEYGGLTYVAGILGQAANFDGIDDLIRIGNLWDPSNTSTPFSFSGWIRIDDDNRNCMALVSQWTACQGNDDHYHLSLYGGNYASNGLRSEVFHFQPQGNIDINRDVITDGNWHHFGVTFDGTSQNLYIDGILRGNKTFANFEVSNFSNIDLVIGGYDSSACDLGSGFLRGSVDEFQIYNRALSATELQEIIGNAGPLPSILQGIVHETDSQGNPVGLLTGATVSISGGGSTTTNTLGQYRFENVQAGTRTVTVSKNGYYPVTRQVTLGSGGVRAENFSLLPPDPSGSPQSYDFKTSVGSYIIDNMPGDVEMETMIAWNGSAGNVRFKVEDQWHDASLIDQSDGTYKAKFSMPAPDAIGMCSELLVEVENGEGGKKISPTGVHILPVGVMIPWYRDSIPWTPSGLELSYAENYSKAYPLSIGSDKIELEGHLGFSKAVSYDILGASLNGSLSGSGGLDFTFPGPYHPEVKILAGAELSITGGLDISFAGCGLPSVTPSWELAIDGKVGMKAPVVLGLDIIAPPTGSILAYIPGINSPRLQLALSAHGSISGEYENFQTGTCFLGATSFNGAYGGGIEGTALIELPLIEGGVYTGGTGTWGVGICPDFSFRSFTGKIFTGVYVEMVGFETRKEVAAEITWDWTNPGVQPKILAYNDFGKSNATVSWEPIGKKPEQWGELNKLAEYSAKTKTSALMENDLTGTEEEKVVENVIGLAAPSVFSNSSGSLILYAHHDTNKPWYAATDIGKIESDGNGGWISGLVTDDQAAEFNPSMADTGSNQQLAAWTRVAGDISSATAPEDVAPHLEIVASRYDTAAKTWTSPEQLTTNSIADRDPLPVVAGSRQGILWIQNQGDKLTGDSTSGDSLLYREWSGTAWSAPSVLFTAQKGILDFTFTPDSGGETYVVFAVDEDGNTETKTDRELYQISTVSGVWQTATRLTNDSLEDSLPVLTAPNGAPMLVWKADETLQYTVIASWSPVPVYSQTTLAGEAPTLDGTTMPGGAAIAYTVQGDNGIDIVAAFYDANLNLWSQPIQLTQDEDAESSLSMIFNGTELVMSYLKTQTLREDKEVQLNGQTQTIPNVPQPGRTDLYVLRHTLGRDLSVAVDSLKTTPVNPAPNSLATLTATVANIGDIAVDNIPVSFYDGDPENGGTLIGETATTGTLIAGASQEVTIAWQLPQGGTPHQVFAVIDPALTIEDRNRANNVTSILTSLPDLTVTSAKSDQITSDTLALTARISNVGAIPSGSFKVSWRLGTVDGPQIATAMVDDVLPGAYYEATGQWVAGISAHADDYTKVYVLVDTAAAVNELKEDNNTGLQSVRLPYASGSLTVTIMPPEAVVAGVQWSVDGGVNWYDSYTQINLPSGSYNIIFKPMPGYNLPSINNVAIQGSHSSTLTGDPTLGGDMNGDSTVDLVDAIIALQVINGGNSSLGQWYDMNGDNKIGLEEAIHILQQASTAP